VIVDAPYVDPSALTRLYLHQDGSLAMARWSRRQRRPLRVTHHGRTEIVNAIGLAAFRGLIPLDRAAEAFEHLDDDFAQGHLEQVDVLWRAALDRSAALSVLHTPTLGTRTLDVLHVACALELRARRFLSFDDRQRKLARAVGLNLVSI